MDRAAVDAFLAAVDGVLDGDRSVSADAMRWSPDGPVPPPRTHSRHQICGTPADCRLCA